MIDKDLLDILACPETKKDLQLAELSVIAKINKAIEEGRVKNRAQKQVSQKIDGGLLRVGDTRFLYPVREGIPILLIEELICLDDIE